MFYKTTKKKKSNKEIYKIRTIDKMDTRPSFVTFNHRKVVSTQAEQQRKI